MGNKWPKYAWMNGEIIPWEKATVHVQSNAFRYGTMVFEGLRGYWNSKKQELYLFRLYDHLKRLQESAKLMKMNLNFSLEEYTKPLMDLIKANNYVKDIHVRYMVYVDSFAAFGALDPIGIGIVCLQKGRGFDLYNGITCSVASWTRIRDNNLSPRIKCAANYQNGRPAVIQAKSDGYNYSIMLNEFGKVTETPTSCVFIMRGGKLVTPRITDGILESITRDSIISFSEQDLYNRVIEREIDRTELYIADEVFICGSDVEVVPVTSIDRYIIGNGERGGVTENIQNLYFEIVRGNNEKYFDWLTPVYG